MRITGVILSFAAVGAVVVLGGWLKTPAPGQVDCWLEPPSDERVECFHIIVPRDYGNPDGASFTLPVAVIKGDAEASDSPAVVMVDGGPGAPVFNSVWPEWSPVTVSFEITEALRKERDIVVFDSRGSGLSQPSLDCHEANEDAAGRTDPPGSDVPFYLRQSEAIRTCWERLVSSGIDFGTVSTTAMADDIATIVDELGYDAIDLWSFSYGTRVSLELIRRHPGLVRAAVLDSTLPTHGSLDTDLPWMTWRAFEQLFDDCEQDPECATAYPNLRNGFLDQIRSLNEEPQSLAIIHDNGRWGEGSVVYMDGNDLVFYIYDAFYVAEALPYLPLVMNAAARNSDHLTWFYWYPLFADWGLSEGVFLTIWCREVVPFTDEAELREQAEEYGPIGVAALTIVTTPACADWPVEPMPRDDHSPVVSEVPVLFVNGAYDPVTPPEWSAEIMEGFSKAIHLVFRAAGHSPSAGEACAVATAVRFLQSAGDNRTYAAPDCPLYLEPDFLIQ